MTINKNCFFYKQNTKTQDMKNLYLFPTDKYSPLVHSTSKYGGIFLSIFYKPMKDMGDSYQNMYIVNNEEIKEGDWACHTSITNDKYQIIRCNISNNVSIQEHWNKIVLTTDEALIADGVQAIDEDFFDWFIKNITCEYVEVIKQYKEWYGNWYKYQDNFFSDSFEPCVIRYKITIQQEKPIQIILAEEPFKKIDDGQKIYSEDDMEKSFNAGIAYAIGSHKDFAQIHPNFKIFIEQF